MVDFIIKERGVEVISERHQKITKGTKIWMRPKFQVTILLI